MTRNRVKNDTKRIQITLTAVQLEEINRRVGLLGSNTSDVIKFIVTDWLNNQKKKG